METAPSQLPSSTIPQRILIRGVNWLGDAVMTTPAMLRLREKFPAAHVTLLAPEKLADLWLHHPAIDQVIPFVAGEDVFTVGRTLRSLKFDLALVLPNSPRSAMEVFLGGVPQRIGYARPWRNFCLTRAVAPRPEAVKMRKRTASEVRALVRGPLPPAPTGEIPAVAHQMHEYLHLAGVLGANPEPVAPRLFVRPDELARVREKFNLPDLSRPILGLNPGAEYGPAKRWPAARFVAAAREIQRQTDCVWLIFGGKNDLPLAGEIESAIRHSSFVVRNLCGQTSLRELMALLKCCRALLTNDTGPMHVAAALGTSVVAPFGSTSAELTGPGLAGDPRQRLLKSDAPCSPCFLRECPIDFRCMNSIGAERAVAAIMELRA